MTNPNLSRLRLRRRRHNHRPSIRRRDCFLSHRGFRPGKEVRPQPKPEAFIVEQLDDEEIPTEDLEPDESEIDAHFHWRETCEREGMRDWIRSQPYLACV